MAGNEKVVGTATSMTTHKSYEKRAIVERIACDVSVPPAADSMIGHCEYYYRPLHCAYTDKVEKMPSVTELFNWTAQTFNPWGEKDLNARLLVKRDALITPECTDSDWSRHSNFMVRHIGCGHRPPAYYLSYGYYYCSNYGAKLKPRLTDAGKDWLDNAKWYLQSNMEDGLKQNMKGDSIHMSSRKPANGSFTMTVQKYQLELADDTFKTFAFKTHPLAYLDGGLATLPVSDLMRIAGQPSIQEWEDSRTWGQAVDSGSVVAKNWLGRAFGRLMAK